MTDIPISGLPNAAAIQGSELIPVVQAGTTVQTTAQSVLEGLSVVSGINISNQTVLATGATTARTLAFRAASMPFVTDFGVIGAGNDSATYLSAASNAQSYFLLPGGNYDFTGAMGDGTKPVLIVGALNLTGNGFPWQTDGTAWNGSSAFGFGQILNGPSNASLVTMQGQFAAQAATSSYEKSILKVQGIHFDASASDYSYSKDGCAIVAQMSAAPGNLTASMCTFNPYLIFGSGSQGHGSVSEFDVINSTGVDDSNNIFAKTGLLVVSQGTNKPFQAVGITSSGAPFLYGVTINSGSVSQWAFTFLYNGVANGIGIDYEGNFYASSLNANKNLYNMSTLASTSGNGNFLMGTNLSNGGAEFNLVVNSGNFSGGGSVWQTNAAGVLNPRAGWGWNAGGQIQANGGFADGSYFQATPTSGSTVSVQNNVTTVQIETGSLAALTIDFPPNPSAGQLLLIGFLNPVTALTLTAPVNINWKATTIPNGGNALLYQYHNGSWERRSIV